LIKETEDEELKDICAWVWHFENERSLVSIESVRYGYTNRIWNLTQCRKEFKEFEYLVYPTAKEYKEGLEGHSGDAIINWAKRTDLTPSEESYDIILQDVRVEVIAQWLSRTDVLPTAKQYARGFKSPSPDVRAEFHRAFENDVRYNPPSPFDMLRQDIYNAVGAPNPFGNVFPKL